jgi:hypothetical protein
VVTEAIKIDFQRSSLRPPGSPVIDPWRVDLYQYRRKVASRLVVERFEPDFLQHLFRVLADLGCRGK